MTDLLAHLAEDLLAKHAIASGKIFLSYSRRNRDFAKALFAKLERMGFELWRDVHDIEAGADDWWQSIQEGIRGCETVILCMSLPALKSPVVGDEWFYARTLGKRIIPIVADDIWTHPEVVTKEFTIPNWMQRKNWMDFRADVPESEAAWANLIRTMNDSYTPKKFINMVGELPPRFVRRPEETDNAIRSLVDDNNDAVAMTTALKGAGGYGKTTLAKAVARDIRIQGAFDDGILWVTLGEELLQKRGDELTNTLIGRVQELIDALGAERAVITSLEMAHTKLKEAIGDRYILVVIDDAWDEAHLKPFLVKGQHSSCLITTRNADTVNDKAIQQQSVDKMKSLEAVELLTAGLDADEVKPLADKLKQLARDLREYPLLLALANTQIANFVTDLGLSVADALQLANETFAEQGVLGFDDTNSSDRNRAVAMSLDTSIRQLKPDERQRMYKELAIFPEDALIPLTTLEKYWGLSKVATLQFCQLLYRKTALLHSFEGMQIRIHDVFRDYLLKQWDAPQLQALHSRLIEKYGDLKALPDDYAWRNLAYHLKNADQLDTLRSLLLDFDFLQAKLNATDTNALLADCATLPSDETIRLLQSTLRMSAHVLTDHKDQLPYQLVGRLWTHRDQPALAPLWQHAHASTPLELLTTQADSPLLPAGSALIRTLEGHTDDVKGALQLTSGDILSWSNDDTLRLWGVDGTAQAVLQGHTNIVTGALQLMSGDILSWAGNTFSDYQDHTLRLWEVDGTAKAVLAGHTSPVSGALQLTSGDILSWTGDIISNDQDHTLRLWSVDGTAQAVLEGHTSAVWGALQLTNGDILSWSGDKTLRLWGVDGTAQAVLQGHTNIVTGALQLTSGDILSWSGDKTLRLWGVDGTAQAMLHGHTERVRGALQLTNGDILSWSRDKTLRLWGVDGTAQAVLAGHTDSVSGALQLRSGDILSWSEDKTLRLWGVDGTAQAVLAGHTDSVSGALQLRSGDILSWSEDKTLRLWGVDGTAQAVLQGHTSAVRGALQLMSGDILSWSTDETLRLWSATVNPTILMKAHNSAINGIRKLSTGDILSWSHDTTLRLWGVDGTAKAVLAGHTDRVNGALQLRSGDILSWSEDKTLRLWGVDGTAKAVLAGHTSAVDGALQLRSGDILSWSEDKTLRVWGVDGTAQAVLEGHTDRVRGALQLRSGDILSWAGDFFSQDKTLRLWGVDGTAKAVLAGHTDSVSGALQLRSGDILSWSEDKTLRVWGVDGTAQAVLAGHTECVSGAMQLTSGDILSWAGDIISQDQTLRVWGVDGTAQAVLAGHTNGVLGARQLKSGDILSWSRDKTLHLWGVDGTAQAVLDEHDWWGNRERIFAWARTHGIDTNELYADSLIPASAYGRRSKGKQVQVYDAQTGKTRHIFVGDAAINQEVVLDDGTIVLGDSAGRVLFLRVRA